MFKMQNATKTPITKTYILMMQNYSDLKKKILKFFWNHTKTKHMNCIEIITNTKVSPHEFS